MNKFINIGWKFISIIMLVLALVGRFFDVLTMSEMMNVFIMVGVWDMWNMMKKREGGCSCG